MRIQCTNLTTDETKSAETQSAQYS